MTEDPPCRPDCPICTDLIVPARLWDAPWPAFRWSPAAPVGPDGHPAPYVLVDETHRMKQP